MDSLDVELKPNLKEVNFNEEFCGFFQPQLAAVTGTEFHTWNYKNHDRNSIREWQWAKA